MNKTLVYGLAVSMIASSMALAAPAKKATKVAPRKATATAKKNTATTKKNTKVAANTTKPVAAPVATAPTTMAAPKADTAVPSAAVAAPTAGQTTSTVQAATAEVKKKKFGFLLVNRADLSASAANRSKGSDASGYLLVRPSYKLSDSLSLAIGQEFGHSYGTQMNGKAAWVMYDPYAMISASNLGTLPGGIATKGSLRFYAPTSESSQMKDTIGMVRFNGTIEKSFGKFSVSYNLEPRVYFQQYNTYIDVTDNNKEKATIGYRYANWLEAAYQFSDAVGMYSIFGIDHRYFNGDSNAGIKALQKDHLIAETAVTVNATKNITILAGISQDTDGSNLRDPNVNKKDPVYRDELMTYFVEADISL